MAKKIAQFKVAGIDLSVNHLGWVMLLGDHVTTGFVDNRMTYARQIKPGCGAESDMCARLIENQKRNKGKELKETLQLSRLSLWLVYAKHLASRLRDHGVTHVSFEQYSFGSQSSSVTGIAEVGGLFRQVFFEAGFRIRFVLPTAIKKWACHGHAKKSQMVEAARCVGVEIPEALTPISRGDATGPGTDIADAFWLADLLQWELRVRHGYPLAKLSPRQIEVFNSATPSMPLNLLSRPFVAAPFLGDEK